MSYRVYSYILVVDDQAGIRRLLFEALTDDGYNVEVAASGAEALLKVRVRTPSLILLDEKMPGMTGLEVLMEMRKFAPEVPVIIVTAYSELANLRAARESKLVQFLLIKPFDLEVVRKLIGTVLKISNKRDSGGTQLSQPS